MLNQLFNFGNYTFYILMAYAISLATLLGLVITSFRQRRYYAQAIAQATSENLDKL